MTTTDTLLDAAIANAHNSPNRVRKVGAVLLPAGDPARAIHAWNTYPRGVLDTEERHLGNLYHLTKIRLACRTRVSGDVTIEPAAK